MLNRSLPTVAPSVPTGSRHRPGRAHATRAAIVATASAAAALLAVLPVDAPAPVPAVAAPLAVPALADAPAPLATQAAALPAPVVTAPAAPASAAPVVTADVAPVAARSTAVQLALGKVGSPYRWGGTGPRAFDCSGLVNWAFDQVGVDLPRTSRALSRVGTPVSRANLQPGDLVFFYSPVSHVGIYIGGGRMVHASTSGKPVAVASIDGRPFHSARRV